MEESVIKRVMPNSLEAEQSVIGSMIMDREAVMAASEILTTEDFYHKQYGILFEAMLELFNDGQPVDLVTLQNRLKEKNVPPEVSSLEYVGNIVAAVPTSANIKYYANIVKEKALLRELIRTTEGIENAAYAQKRSGGGHPCRYGKEHFYTLTESGWRRLCSDQRCCIKCLRKDPVSGKRRREM